MGFECNSANGGIWLSDTASVSVEAQIVVVDQCEVLVQTLIRGVLAGKKDDWSVECHNGRDMCFQVCD
jgi:hypothetical protein